MRTDFQPWTLQQKGGPRDLWTPDLIRGCGWVQGLCSRRDADRRLQSLAQLGRTSLDIPRFPPPFAFLSGVLVASGHVQFDRADECALGRHGVSYPLLARNCGESLLEKMLCGLENMATNANRWFRHRPRRRIFSPRPQDFMWHGTC